MDCSPSGSSVHGISQAGILEWVAISFSKGYSQPKDRMPSPALKAGSFTTGTSLVAQLGKESTCNVGDLGSIPGLGRSPGEGNGNPLQYSCLENPMNRGAWRATVHGVAKESDMTKQLNNNIITIIIGLQKFPWMAQY